MKEALLLATRSRGKAREVGEVLGEFGIRVETPEEAGIDRAPIEEELESEDSFRGNALAKASYFARIARRPTISDDSGLAVDALGGRPGVHTRRFAPLEAYPGMERDAANNLHLLRALEDADDPVRGAAFICVACYLSAPDQVPVFRRGETRGVILKAPKGDRGFGYDPVFAQARDARSFAEMSKSEKNARSHRGKAFRVLGRYLLALGRSSP